MTGRGMRDVRGLQPPSVHDRTVRGRAALGGCAQDDSSLWPVSVTSLTSEEAAGFDNGLEAEIRRVYLYFSYPRVRPI